MEPIRLMTDRLELVLATAAPVRAAANGDRDRLGKLLNATVAADWPPEHVGDGLSPLAEQLERTLPEHGYGMYFFLLREPRTLIGTGGLARRDNGCIDVGYTLMASYQHRGFATEAAGRLIEFAFADPCCRCVVAETLAELTPSIRVLERLGFSLREKGITGYEGDENVVRYALERGQFNARLTETASRTN